MKDTVITAARKRTELFWLAGCLVAAIITNIYAIAHYDAGWAEIFTSLGYVCVFAIVLYVATGAVRMVINALLKLRKHRKPLKTR